VTATVEQTQADLAHMVELARQGEEVVITHSGEPVAKLTGFVSVRPPGYFDDCYDAEGIEESNPLAQRSVRRLVQ
jgi:prevent-host-death family protein